MKIFLLVLVLGVTAAVARESWLHIGYNRQGIIACGNRDDYYLEVTGAELKYYPLQIIPLDELRELPKIKCTFDFKRKVKEMCDGKKSCTINVNSNDFPVSSCQKYEKVLYMYFDCIHCPIDDRRKKREIGRNSSELIPDENDQVPSRTKRQSGQSAICRKVQSVQQSTSRQNPNEELRKKIEKNIRTKGDFICPNDVFVRKHVCHNYAAIINEEVVQNCSIAKENNRGKAQWVSSNTYTLFVSSSTALIGYTQWSDMCKFVNAVPKFKCSKQQGTWSCNFLGRAIAHHSPQSGHYFHQHDIMSSNKK